MKLQITFFITKARELFMSVINNINYNYTQGLENV